MKKWLPWILVAVFGLWVVSKLFPEPQPTFDYRGFAKLPVLMGGRIQPMDSVARNSLLQIRNRQAVFLEDPAHKDGLFPKGTNLTALAWLMDVMMRPDVADEQRVFRIDNLDLLAMLKLSDKEKYFSFNQLKPGHEALGKEASRIEDAKIPTPNQTVLERQVMKLANAMMLYERLELSLHPIGSEDVVKDAEASIKDVHAIRESSAAGKEMDKVLLGRLEERLSGFDMMARMSQILAVPPQQADQSRENWVSVGATLTNSVISESKLDPATVHYAKMVAAYRANQPSAFNQEVTDYSKWLQQWYVPEAKKGANEYFFNHFQPFYLSMIIYVVAFILACSFWFNWSSWMRTSALYLVVLAFGIHTFGLFYRMMLEGRPPVTNLYSSAIFIGWGAAILGMILERIYRDAIGCVIASTAGFLTLVIAHNLAMGGDTMEMLVAVLDSNFWLSTHVTVVTLGYASTFVAGFLAIIYVMRGFFTRTLSEATAKALARMVYGIVCFATLFSFVGTVLGGIWADQSWGRFWGWDPKENGALLIVIWNATILHARWGGMIRERGLMNMTLFGNIITSFSWFGVNMLGIGLHSYGFTDDAKFMWLMIFIGSQLALIAIGMMPKHLWKSFSSRAGHPPSDNGKGGKRSSPVPPNPQPASI